MSKNNPWASLGPTAADTWTKPMTLVYGSYKWLNDAPIHYCMTTLSITSIWDDIRLMSEIPGVEKWGFEALFQRVIRDEWVKQMKAQYLGNRQRFKFFPPVTIALLPCSGDVPQRTYPDDSQFSFTPHEQNGFVAELRGLRLHFPLATEQAFPAFGSPATLAWDKSKYIALAIDGQHRISALREFVPRVAQDKEHKDIPATIVIFDPHLPHGRDLIQLTREIFIDINKNAKAVDSSRLILLDDRNFFNSLTRGLILQGYPDGETASSVEYQQLEDDIDLAVPEGIPQELVDTTAGRESADITKIHDWHFTSAFILNRAIQYFFFENRFSQFEQILETSDWTPDDDEPERQAVASRRQDYASSESELTDDEKIPDSEMLSFRPAVTAELVQRCFRMHRGLLLGVFTAFSPYREHILRFREVASGPLGDKVRALALSEGSTPRKKGRSPFNSIVAQSLKQDESELKAVRKSLEKIYRPKGWDRSLVWYSIFQRGLIYEPLLLQRAIEQAQDEPLGSREQFAATYISLLNELFEEGWFDRQREVGDHRIWNGIALKFGDIDDPPLDGTDGAAYKTGLLTRILVAARASRRAGTSGAFIDKCNKTQGLIEARCRVRIGWQIHARRRDDAAGNLKDKGTYQTLSETLFNQLVNEVCSAKVL